MRRNRAGRLWLTPACAVVACLAMSATALATPGSLEWGKCTKVGSGGKYANAGCTKAAKPGKEGWEWAALSTPVKFTSSKKKETGPAVLSAGGSEVACTAMTQQEGEYNAPKELSNVVLEFGNCETSGIKCKSPGQPEGSIHTNKLRGGPGVIKKEAQEVKNLDGYDLKGQTSEVWAEWSCGLVSYVMRGGVIVPERNATGILQTNKMLNKRLIELFSEKGGGGIERFEGGPDDYLESSVAGGPFAKAELNLSAIQLTNPKTTKIELRQCEMNVC
jgi:hypothetical protein